MRTMLDFLYLAVLALWVGGIAIFTFVVTPAIFRSYSRDPAGEIVGRLFPGYFLYLLVLSALALLFYLLPGTGRSSTVSWVSLVLLLAAIVVNCYVTFRLHPETARIKQQVVSFEQEAPDSPARREFRRLHALGAVLNLFVLLDGAALLALSRQLNRN